MSTKPSDEFIKNACFLVDASSYIFRAYYAVQSELTAPDGTPTHATLAFINMIEKLRNQHQSNEIVLCWDRKGKGKRHEIFPDYKANRIEPPEDLGIQIENSQKFMTLLGYTQLSQEGYEADDLLATITKVHTEKNFIVVTSDKDLMQLINDRVWLLDTMKKKWSHKEAAMEKFGVSPDRIHELQALCGDSVDNIPGAPGIGAKTAAALMQSFSGLEEILEEAQKRHEVNDKKIKYPDALKGKKIENIAENIDQIRCSHKLVSLYEDAPIEFSENNYKIKALQKEKIIQEAQRLGFHKLLERFVEKEEITQNTENSQSKDGGASQAEFIQIKTIGQFKKILNSYLESDLALDTETFHLDYLDADNIVGLSFCGEAKKAYYVPLQHEEKTHLELEKVKKILQEFLNQRKKPIVFQNAKFDLHILHAFGIQWPNQLEIDDTMVASFVLDPSGSHAMDHLAKKYLNHYECMPFSSLVEKGKNFSHVELSKATHYAAEDAWVTLELWKRIKKLLLENIRLDAVYEKLDKKLIPILFKMELEGVSLNLEVLKVLSKQFHKELDETKKAAIQMLKDFGVQVDDHFNFLSPKQIGKVLFEDLKLPVIKKGKTGPSTNVEVLEELSLQHPFPQCILEVRELSKLLNTYVDALSELLRPETKRVHSQFSQTIAQTGRLASSNPNIQNIPIRTSRGKEIRKAFVAEKGNLLVAADYSQVELRLLAQYSQDELLIRAFKDKADIHSLTASKIFSKELTKITKDERRAAKTINFGIIYGQSAFGLAKALKISRKEAQNFIESYFEEFPGIKSYMDSAKDGARESLETQSIIGRRRILKDMQSKNGILRGVAERMAINTPIQASAADLIKLAMIECSNKLLSAYPMAQMILQVHDELIFEVVEENAPQFAEDLKEIMENPEIFKSFNIPKLQVPLQADVEIGTDWSQI